MREERFAHSKGEEATSQKNVSDFLPKRILNGAHASSCFRSNAAFVLWGAWRIDTVGVPEARREADKLSASLAALSQEERRELTVGDVE